MVSPVASIVSSPPNDAQIAEVVDPRRQAQFALAVGGSHGARGAHPDVADEGRHPRAGDDGRVPDHRVQHRVAFIGSDS